MVSYGMLYPVDPAYSGPFGPMAGKQIVKIRDFPQPCMARSVVNTGHPHRRGPIGQLDDVVVLKAGGCIHISVSAHEWFLHRTYSVSCVLLRIGQG